MVLRRIIEHVKSRNATVIALGFVVVVVGVLVGIQVAERNGADRPADGVTALENPAAAGARYPSVVTSPGGETALMSWLEPPIDDMNPDDTNVSGSNPGETNPGDTTLMWAGYDGTAWSAPEVIAEGSDFFTNWADFPSLAVTREKPFAAHWLRKVPGNTYAYHVAMALRSSTGTWSEPFTPHQDRSATEHGFVSLVPVEGAGVLATWLDGYGTAAAVDGDSGHHVHGAEAENRGAMTLHSAMVYPDGTVGKETEVDGMVCDCCQTSAARSGDRVITVYRDRTEGEIRDIYRAVYDLTEETWSEPQALSTEGWEIAGCPVNGPQVAVHGDTVIAAWFTAANNQPRNYMAVSDDGGLSFGDARVIDRGAPAGRVGVAFNREGEALLSWIGSGKQGSRVYGRIWRDSGLGDSFVIGEVDGSRASGFPRAAAFGREFLVAWTDPEDGSSVITVIVSPSGL